MCVESGLKSEEVHVSRTTSVYIICGSERTVKDPRLCVCAPGCTFDGFYFFRVSSNRIVNLVSISSF